MKIGKISTEYSILNINKNAGIAIVSITIIKSIVIALLPNTFWFLFIYTVNKYCTKFIIFELIILYAPADIRPVNDEKQTVKSSGVEVAIPATFPIVFGFKFNPSPSFLKTGTNKYFDITTIIPV